MRNLRLRTLPAVSPVPVLQGIPPIVTIIVLSRLTGVAAGVGCSGGGRGEGRSGNEGRQGQGGDKCLHDTSPCYGASSGKFVHQRGGRSAGASTRTRLDRGNQCLFQGSVTRISGTASLARSPQADLVN